MNIINQLIKIIFCINFALAKVKITIEDNNFSTQDYLIECGINIANNNFDYRLHTSIVHMDVEYKFVDKFLKNYKGTVIIETKRDAAPPKQVVIIVNSFHSFAKTVTKLKPDLRGKTLLSSGANFLILILSYPKKIEKITSFLWSYYVLNVIIVAAQKKTDTVLYTYYPYIDYLHCQNTQPTLLAICNETKFKTDLYPDKIQNMHGCPLYISTDKPYRGNTEQKIPLLIIKKVIVNLLRDIINFTPITSMRDYTSIESNGAENWSESLNDVVSGLSNISFSSVPFGVDKMRFLDYSIPYFNVRLAWIAPPVQPGPVWWKLLWPLNGYLWVLITPVTVLVNLLPFVLKLKRINRICRRYLKKYDKLRGVSLRSWGILMGQSIRLAPKIFRDFYIISLWMWFTFVIRSAYQSVLIVALKTDTVAGRFENLKEAIDYGYKFGGRAGILTHFEHEASIRDGFEIIADDKFEEVFRNVIEGKIGFVLATSLEYAWAYCMALGEREGVCGHVISDSIMTIPLVIAMKNNSPFTKPLSVWLPRLLESGLLHREALLNPSFQAMKSSEATALTFQQTASCFLCLCLCFMLSILVFVFEILTYQIMKCRRGKHGIKFTH